MPTNILIITANTKDTIPLRLDEEVREITSGLQRSANRDEYQLKQVWACRPVDVRRAILDFRPNVVHFSGHGSGDDGLAFEDEAGNTKLVPASVLADFFALFADTVQCVVLNACYSDVQAAAIAMHIPNVVGMQREIGDRAAIEFAVAFYDALASGRTVDFSHRLACNAIAWAGLHEQSTPVLKTSAPNALPVPKAPATPRSVPVLARHLVPRLPCILVLDISASMIGRPIEALTGALEQFVLDLQANIHSLERVELALVTFGDAVSVVRDFTRASDFVVPRLDARGTTPTGEAIGLALDLIRQRITQYKTIGITYYRPLVLLLTDGAPTDDIQVAASRLHSEHARRRLSFVAVGTADADMGLLEQLSPPGQPALKLEDLRFEKLFSWVSTSLGSIAKIDPKDQPVLFQPLNSVDGLK